MQTIIDYLAELGFKQEAKSEITKVFSKENLKLNCPYVISADNVRLVVSVRENRKAIRIEVESKKGATFTVFEGYCDNVDMLRSVLQAVVFTVEEVDTDRINRQFNDKLY